MIRQCIQPRLFIYLFIAGYFAYIESSSPRRQNDIARLVSPYISEESGCFVFWYHMRGSSAGTLNVYVNEKKVFEKWGSQGENWKQEFIELHDHVSAKGYRVSEILYYMILPLDFV